MKNFPLAQHLPYKLKHLTTFSRRHFAGFDIRTKKKVAQLIRLAKEEKTRMRKQKD